MKLTEYIKKHHAGSKAAFARANSVTPQQVTKWINDNWIVVNNKLYSPKRDLTIPAADEVK